MAIETSQSLSHWNYFLCIEQDLLEISRWIEFDERNYSCFSVELARLLMTCSSEVDVLARAICKRLEPEIKAEKINGYQRILTQRFPHLAGGEVRIPRFGLTLHPWENWSTPSTPPDWWTSNNKVKHHRSTHFERASLKHTLNAASALFVLEAIFHRLDALNYLSPRSELFDSDQFMINMGGDSSIILVQV